MRSDESPCPPVLLTRRLLRKINAGRSPLPSVPARKPVLLIHHDPSSSAVLPDNPVAENADPLDLEFDDVAGGEVPALLQATTRPHRARAEHLAWMERLALGD